MKKFAIIALTAATTLSSVAAPSILTLKESITDNAIVYPESFETDTHKMLQNWYLQNFTVLNTNFDQSPTVSATDSVYIKRLGAMPCVIEMPYNQIVRSYINMYTQRRRELVESMLGMSLYYMPIFEQALERHGLPLELRYLPVIESALNPDAVSRVGATGLWQFMLATGRGLGLEVNSLVDERRDPIASSEAAAKYLKQLHNMYNDWSLAIAAYNCGPGNVNKALRRAGATADSIAAAKPGRDFWSIYYYLPQETRGYVPAFIAANYVMTYYNQHSISPALAKRPIITDTIHVNKRVHFNQIAAVLNIPVEELRVLNPQYRKDLIPGDEHPYHLVLPSMQVYSYIMSEDSILRHDAPLYARRDVVEPTNPNAIDPDMEYTTKLVVTRHTVKRGETLSKIASKYNVTVADLKSWNSLKSNSVARGRTLKINTYQRVATGRKKSDSEAADSTLIAAGDTTVVAENIAETGEILAATTIAKPEPTVAKTKTDTAKPKTDTTKAKADTKAKAKPKTINHKIKKGETLSAIASKYKGVTVADIKKANGLKGSDIKAGQTLIIPNN